MSARKPSWVVLKFGGTSVSSEPNWRVIAETARQRRAEGHHVLIVHSALSGVTDRLEKLLAAESAGDASATLEALQHHHRTLGQALGLSVDDVAAALEPSLHQLSSDLSRAAQRRSIDDRLRARVMAQGELMATALGARYLSSVGLTPHWLDARDVLKAESREGASEKAGYLSATCAFDPDEGVQRRLSALGGLVITQGFIAADQVGDTVLLGRGGSDTSAAYFAGLLAAVQLEIWTDVPGMFSANPRSMPAARQLRALTYDEAQEIATAGAKVLHPRCLLPVRRHGIPLFVYSTPAAHLGGTRIQSAPVSDAAQVKAVCIKKGVTLVTLDSPGMWHQVGFLADAFQVFKRLGLSIDLVSTSETHVTVSLDPQANPMESDTLSRLVEDLAPLCRAEVIGPCASVSLVGRNIRSILHQLGDALSVFGEQRIYLVSQAANDLNLTFVVDESQGDRLVEQWHALLVEPVRDDAVLGPSWMQLFSPAAAAPSAASAPWWRDHRDELLALMHGREAAYVYHRETLLERCRMLRAIAPVARVSYAMKANPHPEVLRTVHGAGLSIECVSRGEIERARAVLVGLEPQQILFTPNFAPRAEYAWALAQGVRVTLDNLHPLEHWPELFAGREIFLRLDPGTGRGHHQHVRTGGRHAKFGIALGDGERVQRAVRTAGARVVGLHAHTGSGILEIANWVETARALLAARERFPDVRVLDLGGGLGVPDRVGAPAIDLGALSTSLAALSSSLEGLELWLEPGRFVVAEAGVLLARVTQLKVKDEHAFVGVATGMNSLIRPALYGAHHEIVNLTRLGEGALRTFDVVGPICESGDVLGHERLLPESTAEGDILLVATAGAYGAAMASSYNLRAPAEEFVI